MTSIYEQDLARKEANFAPISPLGFIERTAEVYPDRLAIVHGELRQTWAQTYARCRQLASNCAWRQSLLNREILAPDRSRPSCAHTSSANAGCADPEKMTMPFTDCLSLEVPSA